MQLLCQTKQKFDYHKFRISRLPVIFEKVFDSGIKVYEYGHIGHLLSCDLN